MSKIYDDAYKLGAEHARNVATWVTDGNDTDDSRRRKLQIIEDDGPDEVISRPSLSGEHADGLTPLALFQEVVGRSPVQDDELAALCDAYEEGVSDNFELALVSELKSALGEAA